MTPEEHDRFVAANRDLVTWVVGRLKLPKRGDADIDDAIQDGVIGLVKAAHRFNPSHGARFSTYAVRTIRNSVLRGVNGMRHMRPSNGEGGYRIVSYDQAPQVLSHSAETIENAEDTAITRMANSELRDAIDSCQLAPREREAIFVTFFDQCGYNKLDRKQQRSLSSARTRALAKLRMHLAGKADLFT